jgi:pimeloyl-ACP methyl ester carboxylesterase
VHIDNESLVTDELVDYIHRAHNWSPEFMEARRQSVSVPHDYTQDLAGGIQAPVLLIHGRYNRMVPFEVSIAILNHIADSRLVLLNNCGHWPPFEKPAEWTAQVLGSCGATERDGWRQNPISSSARRRVDHPEMRLGCRLRAVSDH